MTPPTSTHSNTVVVQRRKLIERLIRDAHARGETNFEAAAVLRWLRNAGEPNVNSRFVTATLDLLVREGTLQLDRVHGYSLAAPPTS